jgi:pimeloyl-ACP methyl ester carboxylesterase
MIPFIDFGGTGPLLHLAHANGYPAQTYTPLIETLTPHYHVVSSITRAQWPDAQAKDLPSWEPFVDDLFQFMEEQGAQNVIGVGHSLGAMVTLVAALRRPELFKALVLIEPVLFRRRLLTTVTVARRLGLLKRLHPLIPTALKRRRLFASADEMFSRYRKARIFSRIDDRGLHAYVDSLAQPRPDGQVELAISPEWEARIYEQGPFNIWSQLKNLQPPLMLIRGAETDTLAAEAVEKLHRTLPNAVIHNLPNTGHLVPLEKPDEVSGLILKFLEGR